VSLYAKLAIILAGVVLGFVGGWRVHAWKDAADRRDQVAKAEQRAASTARQTFRNQENRDAEDLAVHARLADALERLRRRPDRVPAAAAAACEGGTGAQLSGPDAGFLEREAARADLLRSALRECYGWADAVTGQP
jgi:hypothetical protein